MKILLHEAQKHSKKNQRKPFPWFGKQLNGHTTRGERTHAGLAPSNSFILPAISQEIGARQGMGFKCGEKTGTKHVCVLMCHPWGLLTSFCFFKNQKATEALFRSSMAFRRATVSCGR